MEKLYIKLLAWSIMRIVNRQKTYQARCERLNVIVNWLLDIYSDYNILDIEEVVNYDN